jgi:hypothetical protein
MNSHENLQFKDPNSPPTNETLTETLGKSYTAYETFQDTLSELEIEQVWQWYKPYKAWFAKGQHFWTTARGIRKEKTLYWLHVYDEHFCVVIWFKEKNRTEILNADVSEETRQLIREAKEWSCKMPTFPVIFDITMSVPIDDIRVLIDCKKRLEK